MVFLENIDSGGDVSLNDVFEDVDIPEEEKTSLIAFFEFLGASGVEEQKNMLQTFGQVFKKAEERRLLDYEQKGKMFLKLSILFGVGIVILLL